MRASILSAFVFAGMVSASVALHAQEPSEPSSSALRPWKDEGSGHYGVVDDTGMKVHAAEYDLVLGGDDATAVGFKRSGGTVFILGTRGWVKPVSDEAFWKAWRAALSESDISDKQLIGRVMDLYPEPGKRLHELEALEQVYREMPDVRKAAVRRLLLEK